MLRLSLATAYTVNGGKVRRQCKGMPMGIPHAPQMANLACYTVEKQHVLTSQQQHGHIMRYIDDFFVSGTMPPPADAYGMEYSKTSSDPKEVIYLGVRCRVEGNTIHTTLFDREEDYPFHITRYPEWDTTAPRTQLGGVLMGRFIACLEACSHMQEFKESVGNVVRHAVWRNYPPSLIQSVWARFLHRHWQATDIRTRELLNWFRKWMQHLRSQGVRNRPPDPRVPQPPIRNLQDPSFLPIFGRQVPPPPTSLPPPLLGVAQDRSPSQDRHPPPKPQPDKGRLRQPAASVEDDVVSDLLALGSYMPPTDTCPLSSANNKGTPVSQPTHENHPGRSTEAASSSCIAQPSSASSHPTSGHAPIQGDAPPQEKDKEKGDAPETRWAQSSSGASRGHDPAVTLYGPHTPGSPGRPSSLMPGWTQSSSGVSRGQDPVVTLYGDHTPGSPGRPDSPVAGPHGSASQEQHIGASPMDLDPVEERQLVVYQPFLVERPILVDRPVPMPIQVPVLVDRPVPFPVEILVQVPVYIPIHIPVSGPVPVPLPVHVPPSALQPASPVEDQHPLALTAPASSSALALPPPPSAPAALMPPPPLRPPQPTPGSPRARPLAIEWHPEENSETPTPPRKRRAADSGEDSGSSQGSSSGRKGTKKYRKLDMKEWPPHWTIQYQAFLEHPRDREMRKAMWHTWPPELRHQVWYKVSTGMRQLFDQWEAEATTPPQPAPAHTSASAPTTYSISSHLESRGHNWKEGERIGEAKNPGPNGRNRSRNRAPRVRPSQAEMPARRHGARAASQALVNTVNMNNQPIGTPGNDGQFGAKDLRPGWRAGSQPESQQPTRGGPAGVHADHQRGVRRHAVNPAIPDPDVADLIRCIQHQLDKVQADIRRITAMRTHNETPQAQPPQPSTNNNPWSPIAPRRRNRKRRGREEQGHSRGLYEAPSNTQSNTQGADDGSGGGGGGKQVRSSSRVQQAPQQRERQQTQQQRQRQRQQQQPKKQGERQGRANEQHQGQQECTAVGRKGTGSSPLTKAQRPVPGRNRRSKRRRRRSPAPPSYAEATQLPFFPQQRQQQQQQQQQQQRQPQWSSSTMSSKGDRW